MVKAAIPVSFVPCWHLSIASMVLGHIMQLLCLGADHCGHFIPIIEERADKIVHILALLIYLVGARMSLIRSIDDQLLLALSDARAILILSLLLLSVWIIHLQNFMKINYL